MMHHNFSPHANKREEPDTKAIDKNMLFCS